MINYMQLKTMDYRFLSMPLCVYVIIQLLVGCPISVIASDLA